MIHVKELFLKKLKYRHKHNKANFTSFQQMCHLNQNIYKYESYSLSKNHWKLLIGNNVHEDCDISKLYIRKSKTNHKLSKKHIKNFLENGDKNPLTLQTKGKYYTKIVKVEAKMPMQKYLLL